MVKSLFLEAIGNYITIYERIGVGRKELYIVLDT